MEEGLCKADLDYYADDMIKGYKLMLKQKIVEQIEMSKQLVEDRFITPQQDKDFCRAMDYVISILESEDK